MTWLMLFALLIVILVAGAVLPRRRTADAPVGRRQFPWFWITFPVAMFCLAMGTGTLLRLPGPMTYGWTMYAPLSNAIHQPALPVSGLVWLVAAIVGALLSLLAWRRDRV